METSILELIDFLKDRKAEGAKYVAFHSEEEVSKDNIFFFESAFDVAEYCYENTTDVDIYTYSPIDKFIANLEMRSQMNDVGSHDYMSSPHDKTMAQLLNKLGEGIQNDQMNPLKRKRGI